MENIQIGRPRSDMHVARLLASVCIVLYLTIFATLFVIASSHGASPEKMIGLELPDYADTIEYKHLAESMVRDHRFAISPSYPLEAGRVPGYPAFFIVVQSLLGTLVVVPLIQIIFTACTVALIYLLGVQYFKRRVALAAAIIYMIDPIVMYATWIPISETLFMLLFIGSVYAIGVPHKRSWLPYVVAGILFALSVYVRPIGMYLGPAIAIMAFVRENPPATALRNAAIFLAAAFLVMSPWMMRNYRAFGHFEFASSRAWQFYAYHMPLFEQARTGVGYHQIVEENNKQFGTDDEIILRQFKYVDRLDAIWKAKVMEHPIQFAAFYIFRSYQVFTGSSIVTLNYFMHQVGILEGDIDHGDGALQMLLEHRWRDALVQTFTHVPRLIERVFWVLAFASTLFSVYMTIRKKEVDRVWVIAAFVLINFYVLTIGSISGETRYRMPIEPFLLLLAAYGAYALWPRIWKLFENA